MRGRRLLFGAALLTLLGATGRQDSPLERLRWLAGCWEMRRGTGVTFEMWMPPAGAQMLGAARTVQNGAVREFEHTRLGWIADSLVYYASPSGQQPTAFRGGAPTDTGFVVANPAHDFPQRIIYRRRGADSLIARIEGPGANGVRGVDYPMRRVSCTAP